jgi:hypothetical protein
MDITNQNLPEDKRKLLINNLLGSSDEQIISLLTELRKSDNLLLLPFLLEMLYSTRTETLKKAIIEYISDLKDEGAVPTIIQKLEKSFPSQNVTPLITACWQSRLDFSKHLGIFFNILLSGTYLTAFEAFTVIENSIDNISSEELTKYISTVKKGILKSDRDKQLLLIEMVSVLEKAKREIQ